MTYILLFTSVFFGYLIARKVKDTSKTFMPVLLAFSGAFLLSITLFELLPEVFVSPSKQIGVYILLGILLQLFLEFFSKGAEHGHVHGVSRKSAFPWVLFISLSIHALFEGFPIGETNHLLVGILIHKIPIAIILSLFFIKANYSNTTTLVFLFFFALMTPLGNLLANQINFFQNFEIPITAVTIGILFHVSTTILFESSKNHTFNLSKMTAVLFGVVLAYFL